MSFPDWIAIGLEEIDAHRVLSVVQAIPHQAIPTELRRRVFFFVLNKTPTQLYVRKIFIFSETYVRQN